MDSSLQALAELPAETRKKLADDALCKRDRIHHFQTRFYIQDQENNVRLMSPLKRPQLKLEAAVRWCEKEERPIRIIVLKERKGGVSSWIQAYCLVRSWDGSQCLTLAHDKDTTKYIFGIGDRYYRLYEHDKPETKHSSTTEIRYRDGEGCLMVQTAGNRKAGSGLTPHVLHCSEPPKWPKGAETASALMQSVGSNPQTAVFLEGTGYGYDSLFYPRWEDTNKHVRVNWIDREDGGLELDVEILDETRWNGYIPVFSAWFEDHELRREFRSPEERARFETRLNDYDRWLMDEHDCDLEQVYWYETSCLTDRCGNDERTRKQEWPSIPSEAFQGKGGNRFKDEPLERMKTEEGIPISLLQKSHWGNTIEPQRDSQSLLRVCTYPRPRHRYLLSFDPAGGRISDGSYDPDKSVFHVYDLDGATGMEQVARYASYEEEEVIFQVAHIVALWYNNAFVVPLVTGGRGVHFTSKFREVYPAIRIWSDGKNFGLVESTATKAKYVSEHAVAIEHGNISFFHPETVRQHLRYKRYPNGKLAAPEDDHDDEVAAGYAAVVGAKKYPLDFDKFLMKRKQTQGVGMDSFGGYSLC